MALETATTTSHVSTPIKLESQLLSTESFNKTISISKVAEKKVRFSEDLIQGAFEKISNTEKTEIKNSSLKNMPQAKTVPGAQDTQQELDHNQEGMKNNQEQKATDILTDSQPKTPGQFDSQETSVKELKPMPDSFVKEETKKESKSEESACDRVGSQNSTDATASTEQNMFHMVEPQKNITSRNTDELIDSSLSVLSLESADSSPVHSTSTEKARENGKIV
ncbi:uncharacterized protein LOC128535307 [Clarias gariepinus]|uniref:uncharacterized protein LOC128535307 n=1 Tax=Clarias gariepinus TaxID=13013 RepID=UPI00234D33E8|nr:uncharacterized protein LOC128535307 [Clarias gariepinus]